MPLAEQLKGKKILIGKDPVQGKLSISLEINGVPKATVVGEPGSVPNCVSRCKPVDKVAHCRLDVDPQGHMTITNLKDRNVTYVDGMPVLTKAVNEFTTLELGHQRYRVDVAKILKAAGKLLHDTSAGHQGAPKVTSRVQAQMPGQQTPPAPPANMGMPQQPQWQQQWQQQQHQPQQPMPPAWNGHQAQHQKPVPPIQQQMPQNPMSPGLPKPQPQTMSIAHLAQVWDYYHNEQLAMKKKQRDINLIRSISPIFSISGGIFAGTCKSVFHLPDWVLVVSLVFTVIGVSFMIYSFIATSRENTIEKTEMLNDWFQDAYICPNPECGTFLGNKPWKQVRKMKGCSCCKTKYIC